MKNHILHGFLNGSNLKTELVAGLTTFLTMLYIAFVNPSILNIAGIDAKASFVTTCLVAGIGSILMGIIARLPIAVAPAMGLNAYFAFAVVGGMQYSWQVAMGAVFWGSLFLFVLSILRIRVWLMSSIPESLKIGIGAGIGLFIALIGLNNAGIIVANPSTMVALGDLTKSEALLGLLSLLILIIFAYRGLNSGIFISIAITSFIALIIGKVHYTGIVSLPTNITSIIGQVDILGALDIALFGVIFSFLLINLFDSSGTLLISMNNAKIPNINGKHNTLQRAFEVDSVSSVVGAYLATSSVTAYIESNSGISAGGKSGVVSIVVGILFLLMMFFSPLTTLVPVYATSGALIYVGFLMSSYLKNLNFNDVTESVPAFLTALMMPFTYSITDGIAIGFISYVVIKLITNRLKDLHVSVFLISVLFLIKFVFIH